MKSLLRHYGSMLCIAFAVVVSGCGDSGTDEAAFDPIGEWKYPANGTSDSTLSRFTLRLAAPDTAVYLGYLDGNRFDSLVGTWKATGDSLVIQLPKCVHYGLLPVTSLGAGALADDPCVTEIRLAGEGATMRDRTGKTYRR